MRSAALTAAALVAAAGSSACGASAREQARREAAGFDCKDRAASYTAAHHLGGDELGVQLDCAAAGPRIVRWKSDRSGDRLEDARSMSPGEFDQLWRNIAGTGWENLKDCTTGTLGKQDPIYVFDVRDDQHQASFQCQSTRLPFPYNGIADPLDLAAQRGRSQLGDDEPEALKELEKGPKAPQGQTQP